VAEPNEPLTERELEVVKLVAAGASNKQIAASLFISENTVKVHLKNIFVKLEVENRARVAAIAQRNGWIDEPALVGDAPAAPVIDATIASTGASVAATLDATKVIESTHQTLPEQPIELEPVVHAAEPSRRVARPVVPVAPNPQPQPPLALWRRVLMGVLATLALVGGVFATRINSNAAQPGVIDDDIPGVGQQESDSGSRRWFLRNPLPAPRTRSVAFGTPAGRIVLIGGAVERTVNGSVLIYEAARDAWRDAEAKPTPLRLAAGAQITDTIYMPGGLDANGAATASFEVFDSVAERWWRLPPMPRAVSAHIVAAAGERIYVFGGRGPDERLNRDGYMFDPARGTWFRIPGLPTPRAQAAAAVVNDRLYVIGGTDGVRELTTCEVLDIKRNVWAACKPMFIGRGGFSLANVAGGLYAIGGGVANTFIPFNERYDPVADRWTRFEIPTSRVGVWKNTAVASLPTEFYVMGGSTDAGESRNETFVFEVLLNRTYLPRTENNAGGNNNK
jgi:DNA-binding CsgD family transcriptional regulator/N-acetylneuraminic acid mutarotase